MDVYALVEKLGGEICLNRARVRIGSDIVVIGVLNGNDMIFTEDGRKLLEQHTDASEDSKPRRGGRPAKSAAVESEPVTPQIADLFDDPDVGLT